MKDSMMFEVFSVERFFQGNENKCIIRLGEKDQSVIICKGILAGLPAISNIGWGTQIEFFFESAKKEKRLYGHDDHLKPFFYDLLKIKKDGKKVIFYKESELFYFEIELSQEKYKIFEKIPENYFFSGGLVFHRG
jgi:hypothetical protein